ncbi:hypothetical protein GGS24DRAFT_515708 [Hypoxylon argillaceum]|nr:hypothetical protein GGS24DRAFT_515708 [Hypoxylon argillaceum]
MEHSGDAQSPLVVYGDRGNKGLGLFTTRPITSGSILFSDALLLSLHLRDSLWILDLIKAFTTFYDDIKTKYLALKLNENTVTDEYRGDIRDCITLFPYSTNQQPILSYDEALQVVGIFLTNACPLGNNRYGIFPEYSRINHSCRPNSSLQYNVDHTTLYVHAMKDLEEGEEVTISYLGRFIRSCHAKRIAQLGFDCKCDSCSPLNRRNSDLRRCHIENLETSLFPYLRWVGTRQDPRTRPLDNYEAISMAREIVKLMELEGLITNLPSAYRMVAICQLGVYDKEGAKSSIRKGEYFERLHMGNLIEKKSCIREFWERLLVEKYGEVKNTALVTE